MLQDFVCKNVCRAVYINITNVKTSFHDVFNCIFNIIVCKKIHNLSKLCTQNLHLKSRLVS